MDRISRSVSFHGTICMSVDYGSRVCVPIEQQMAEPFNIDPATGRPVDDISAFIRSQGLEQRRILDSLNPVESTYLGEDITDEQAVSDCVGRYCQLPSEFAEFTEQQVRRQIEEELRKQQNLSDEEFNKILEERVAEYRKRKDDESKSE